MSEEEAEELRILERTIAENSKLFVLRIDAWRYFTLWSSSFETLKPAGWDALFSLTQQQATEFAFGYDRRNNPETFILFVQPHLYECFKYIGIKNVSIFSDGIVVRIDNFEMNDFYIAGLTFKIPTSIALSEKLISAKEKAKYCQLVKITGEFNSRLDKINWQPTEVHSEIYPLV